MTHQYRNCSGGTRRLKQAVRALAIACLCAVVLPIQLSHAAPPEYWLLRPPAKSAKHDRRIYQGRPTYLSRDVYAYGWFGVQPRQHWVRHEGLHQRYVQWRKR